MKFSKLSQLVLVSALGLIVAVLLTSCEIVTIDYVFVASSTSVGGSGQIQTYDADSRSGALRPGQPDVPSGGTLPVSLAVDSVYQNLYVVNQGSSTVVHFAVASNGVLTQKDSISTSNSPVAVAVDSPGTYLYVLSGPSPAVLTVYSLTNGTIGSQVSQQPLSLSGISDTYASDVLVPTGLTVLANNSYVTGNAVFVTAYDQSSYNPGGTTTSNAKSGWVFGFAINSGVLSASPGSPYLAGIKPSAIASTPTNQYVYVIDYPSDDLIGYSILDGVGLHPLINGPFKTSALPTAITIEPRGKYIYVANSGASAAQGGGTVSCFIIDLGSGTPTTLALTNNATDTDPVAITVDQGVGTFVYTANYQGNTISGFDLNVDSGELTPTQATPYPSGAEPSAVIAIPAGNHAVQATNP